LRFRLTDNIKEKSWNSGEVFCYLTLAYILVLPVSFHVSIYLFLFALLFRIFSAIQKQDIRIRKSHRWILILFGLFFIVTFTSILYSENYKNAIDIQTRYLTLIFIPALLFIGSLPVDRFYFYIKKSFILGNFIASIICLFYAIIHCFKRCGEAFYFDPRVLELPQTTFWTSITQGGNYFFYADYSVLMSASYFGMYLITCLVFLTLPFLYDQQKLFKHRWINIGFIIFFLVQLFQVSSRATFLSLVAILVFLVISVFKKNKKIAFLILVMLVAFFVSLLFLPRFMILDRTINFLRADKKEITDDGSVLRLMIWKDSFEIIRRNVVFGVGIGDAENMLAEQYKKEIMTTALKKRLNVHNQFLQTFLETGVFGFMILLGFFILPFLIPVNHHKYSSIEANALLIILLCHFFFESVLLRYHGIAFFAMFYSVLMTQEQDD